MTASIAAHGERLAPLMREGRVPLRLPRHREHPRRGSRVPEGARQEQHAHQRGAARNTAVAAVDMLHRHGMLVVGGLIVGNPDERANRSPPT